jgi:quinol monooxygenase YgiN
MAVIMTADVPGMDQQTYEGMMRQFQPAIVAANGFIVHTGHAIDGGWRVTEVWESRAAFDSWFDGTVKPSMPPGMEPAVSVQEVHAVVTP